MQPKGPLVQQSRRPLLSAWSERIIWPGDTRWKVRTLFRAFAFDNTWSKGKQTFRPSSKAKRACNAWCTRFAMVEQSRFNCRPINDTHTKLSELALKGGGDIRPSLRSSIEFSAIRTMVYVRTCVRWIGSSSEHKAWMHGFNLCSLWAQVGWKYYA